MNFTSMKYLGTEIWLICALIYFAIGYYKTKEIVRWLIIGALSGPLAIIWVISTPKNKYSTKELKRDYKKNKDI